MPTTYEAGAAGNMSVNAVVIPIVKWTAKTSYKEVDTTSSKDYNATDAILYASQLKTVFQIDFDVEGFIDLTTYKAGLINQLKKNDVPISIVLKLDAATTFASFLGDVLDVEVTMTVTGAIAIKATGKSNGQITF